MVENAIHFGLPFHEMDDPCLPHCLLARECRVKSAGEAALHQGLFSVVLLDRATAKMYLYQQPQRAENPAPHHPDRSSQPSGERNMVPTGISPTLLTLKFNSSAGSLAS